MMDAAEDVLEKTLLLQLQQGSEAAFDRLYHLYSNRIFGNIKKMVQDQDIARELLQDVFVKIWEKRRTIDAQQSFRSYLFTISRNLVYDYFRNESLERKLQAYLSANREEAYSHIEEDLFYDESNALFIRTIEKLPPQRKQVFTLCKIEGRSYEEVSKLLGISQSTISDHLLKANKFIRTQFIYPAMLAVVIAFF